MGTVYVPARSPDGSTAIVTSEGAPPGCTVFLDDEARTQLAVRRWSSMAGMINCQLSGAAPGLKMRTGWGGTVVVPSTASNNMLSRSICSAALASVTVNVTIKSLLDLPSTAK